MNDSHLLALLDELKAQMAALNDLHHPVYPGNPKRITELEARITDLKAAISARKAALKSAAA